MIFRDTPHHAAERLGESVQRRPDVFLGAGGTGIYAGIWTVDAAFLSGCGLPTWTTDTLPSEVTRASSSRRPLSVE